MALCIVIFEFEIGSNQLVLPEQLFSDKCGRGLVVERELPKLEVGVRFPPPAPTLIIKYLANNKGFTNPMYNLCNPLYPYETPYKTIIFWQFLAVLFSA